MPGNDDIDQHARKNWHFNNYTATCCESDGWVLATTRTGDVAINIRFYEN